MGPAYLPVYCVLVQNYTTTDDFINKENGPFVPSVFFRYTADEALGLVIETWCVPCTLRMLCMLSPAEPNACQLPACTHILGATAGARLLL